MNNNYLSKEQQILIHIGYHKTATTWLQNTVFNNSKWFFPLRTKNTNKGLARLFYKNEKNQLLSPFQNKYSKIPETFDQILKSNSNYNLPIMSDERLSGNIHSGGFDSKDIAQRIKTYIPNARILIVIREQKSMIKSAYFQYLKVGGTDTIKQYLTRKYDNRRPGFCWSHLEYDLLIQHYQQLFGKENVLILPYEQLIKSKKDFVKQIFNFCKIELDDEKIDFSLKNKRKESNFLRIMIPSLNVFNKKTSMNAFSPVNNKIINPIFLMLIRLFSFLIPPFVKDWKMKHIENKIDQIIQNHYMKSNSRLSSLVLFDLKQYNYK